MRYLPLFLPIIVLSSTLSGCNFGYRVAPFALLSIEKSNELSTSDMLVFSWDGEPQGVNYSVCIKNKAMYNDCQSIADVSDANQAFVRFDSVLFQSQNEFFVLATDDFTAMKSNDMTISPEVLNSLVQYIKAPNSERDDRFGHAVSLSANGHTLAVGAYLEDSAATLVDGDLFNNNRKDSGAVYVYQFDGRKWGKSAYIKSPFPNENNQFGYAISLSANGQLLAIGEKGSGLNDQVPANSAAKPQNGTVYLYEYSYSAGWQQIAQLNGSNTGIGDSFGESVSLDAFGKTLAVGASGEDSNAKGINGEQNNELASDSGAAYIFEQKEGKWSQTAYIKSSNSDSLDKFGQSLSLSADGKTLAVGATGESSDTLGVNSVGDNNIAQRSGAVYLYRSNAGQWTEQAYIKASNAQRGDLFGSSVSLSSNGNALAIGAVGQHNELVSQHSDLDNKNTQGEGAAYFFQYSQNSWQQKSFIKAENADKNDQFGHAVSISADASMLAVGAKGESSYANIIGGEQFNDDQKNSGAVYLYSRMKDDWLKLNYVKSPNGEQNDLFGSSLSLSADGDIIAVGASGESSGAKDINGDQLDNTQQSSGAVYVY